MPDDVLRRLHQAFEDRLHVAVRDADAELIETGLLDSLRFVELLFAVEQLFNVHVDLNTVDLDDFRSLRQIAAFVERHTRAGTAGGSGAGLDTRP